MTITSPDHRIRSFVRRQGRMTESQRIALDTLWPQFGLTTDERFDPEKIFGRTAPLTLEIGFGNGASLAEMAEHDPDSDFIGIEVHRPGVGHLLLEIQQRKLENIRIYCADAIDVLNLCIEKNSLARLCLFFPDPWHKKRHNKRRIVSPAFLSLVASRLASSGIFHAATDWEDYAHAMLETLDQCAALENTQLSGGYAKKPDYRPLTKFEQRGHRLGHGVWDLLFQKKPESIL